MNNNSSRILHIFAVLAIWGSSILSTGCYKSRELNVVNQTAVSSQTTWNSESTADLFLNDIYANLPDLNNYDYDPLDNWSDNGMSGFNWPISATTIRNMTTITPSSGLVAGPSNVPMDWNGLYGRIRKCNVFITNVAASTALSADYKTKRTGEARTIRALFYQYLWMSFGSVPIITVPDNNTTEGQDIDHSQSNFDQIFTFIDAELDTAAQLLPANSGNSSGGRITQGAALTLKGWVELFYASPLKNPSNDPARWAAAAATNKQVMSLGYSLHPKYDELFLGTGNNNNEGILYREYIGMIQGSNVFAFQGPSKINQPPLNFSWGGSTATQELVDDYAMANGKAISDPGSGYDPNNPYVNREPRFYQSILYNNSTLNGWPFTSYLGVVNGIAANNPLDQADAGDNSNTGYAVKKRMDTTVVIANYGASSQNAYFFRYAEVLLNYAEAQNEAVGPDASVYAALDQIRTRAGIPTISTVYPGLTQGQMRQVIRKERRVELAFEDKRYWDLIRWKIAEVKINQPLHGMEIAYDGSKWTYTIVAAARGNRVFDASRNYLLPIPQSALDQNSKLVQNPGY